MASSDVDGLVAVLRAPAPAAETDNKLNSAEKKSEGLACSVMEHVLLSIDPVATCGEAAALIGVHQQVLCDVEYSFSTAKSMSWPRCFG